MKKKTVEKVFTLSEMLECWEVAQDSWAKECGAPDLDEIEDEDYTIPINKAAWFKERFKIDVKNQ